ncbi:MAG: hypothetical protein RIS47_517 [Bacteroidota bacterium]|jgi:hypothetical protein
MKLHHVLTIGSLFVLHLSSCNTFVPDPETAYGPVLMERSQLEKSVVIVAARKLVHPGKIYYYNNKVYINEKNEGVHIVDNTDPKQSVFKSFLTIPGCIDIAVRNGILYADNAVDLVAIDLNTGQVTERIPQSFNELLPPDLTYLPQAFDATHRPENTVIVAWEQKK